MANREQKRKPSPARSEDAVEQEHTRTSSENTAQTEQMMAELDDLLDEIDEVLETNAEDFVKSYVQKGGQ